MLHHQLRQRVLSAVLVAALFCGTWARPFAGFGKDNTLRVLAIGDSITQGSVPSKNLNHPYTIQLQQQLQQAFKGRAIDVDNASVGGAGIFAVGFRNPINLITAAERALGGPANRRITYDYVVVMAGINDLLREGRSAADVMEGLKRMYGLALEKGATVVALPPFSAPGFVSRDDYKEGQRRQLADSIVQYANNWNQQRPQGPAIIALNLQQQINFYAMPDAERRNWLDDGLHLTAAGYDQLGKRIAAAIAKAVKASEPARRAPPI